MSGKDAVSPEMYETYRQDSYRAALAKIIYLYLQRRGDQSYHKNLQRLSKGCRGARTGVTVRVSRRGLRAFIGFLEIMEILMLILNNTCYRFGQVAET